MKRLLLLLGSVVLLLELGYQLGFRITSSESLPRGLYRLSSEPPRRGCLVVASLPGPLAQFLALRGYLPGASTRVAKILIAMPGDVVEVSSQGILVNRILIPGSKPLERDRLGRRLPRHPAGSYRLQPGEVCLYAPHPRSVDCRYYGPVAPAPGELSTLRPVVTE